MLGQKLFFIVILFSVIFGGLLYVITTFLIKKLGKEKQGRRTKHIWVWRISIFLVIAYMFIVLWMNKSALNMAVIGPLDFMLMAFLVVFFTTLVEVAIIDLLLPDILKIWHRIGLEMVIFFIITASSMAVFFLFKNWISFV